MKRARSPSDVDGAETSSLQSKKQRLHLQFFTSRLSMPYAAPASYIVGRGESKIAAWAKQKGFGTEYEEGSLRRVASMNRIKKRLAGEGRAVRRSSSSAEMSPNVGRSELPRAEGRHGFALPPSPLGISNYAALDDEDLFPEQESSEPDSDNKDEIYSDFNVLDPVERDSSLVAEEDQAYSVFARAPLEVSQLQLRRDERMADEMVSRTERPPSPPDLLREVLKEKEKQGESSFMEL
ncbi:MAG: hypothetical protein M1821_000347 [Bathelium mastoideum]|nr:MAG: hypothetical protein M1821_000347 [Bathelium mastoideum]